MQLNIKVLKGGECQLEVSRRYMARVWVFYPRQRKPFTLDDRIDSIYRWLKQ